MRYVRSILLLLGGIAFYCWFIVRHWARGNPVLVVAGVILLAIMVYLLLRVLSRLTNTR